MLHSRRLLYINEIARCGSIRKAAARLNVASSAVNRQVLALEEEIGAPLFERLPRGLRLTAAGELCIEHIRDVLKNYERLEGRIRSLKMQQAGKVRMVTTVGLAAGPLPEIIARFLSEHPRVFVQLRNDTGGTTASPVVSGEVDIGLGFNIPAMPGIRTLGNFDIPIGVVLPPWHQLIGPGPINLADVTQKAGSGAAGHQPARGDQPCFCAPAHLGGAGAGNQCIGDAETARQMRHGADAAQSARRHHRMPAR